MTLENYLTVAWILLTAASVLLAAGLGMLTYTQNQTVHRRARTIEILSALHTSEQLEEANWCVIGMLRKDEKHTLADLTGHEERCLVRLLNFYEFVCTSLLDNVLDTRTVGHLRGGAMVELYGLVQAMIVEWRNRLARDDLYANYERFSKSYKRRIAPA